MIEMIDSFEKMQRSEGVLVDSILRIYAPVALNWQFLGAEGSKGISGDFPAKT